MLRSMVRGLSMRSFGARDRRSAMRRDAGSSSGFGSTIRSCWMWLARRVVSSSASSGVMMRNLRQNAAKSDVVASVCYRVPVAETGPSDHGHMRPTTEQHNAYFPRLASRCVSLSANRPRSLLIRFEICCHSLSDRAHVAACSLTSTLFGSNALDPEPAAALQASG